MILADGATRLTAANPFSIAATEEYSSLFPMGSPFAAVRTK
jgi:hypothetical protein